MMDSWLLLHLNHWVATSSLGRTQAQLFNGSNISEWLLASAIVALWFYRRQGQEFIYRTRVMLMFFSLLPTYAIARILQTLGQRPRPIVAVPLEVPMDPQIWEWMKSGFSHLGSLPSDHAALFFIFTTVLFTVSHRLAMLSLLFNIYYSALRVGIGYHWPSDILAGALLGIIVAMIALRMEPSLKGKLQKMVSLFEQHPMGAYTISSMLLGDLAQSFAFSKTLIKIVFHQKLFH